MKLNTLQQNIEHILNEQTLDLRSPLPISRIMQLSMHLSLGLEEFGISTDVENDLKKAWGKSFEQLQHNSK